MREGIKEDLFTIIIFSTDRKPAKWRNVQVYKAAAWKRTENAIKRLFPGVTAVNVYGKITRQFYEQIKFGSDNK